MTRLNLFIGKSVYLQSRNGDGKTSVLDLSWSLPVRLRRRYVKHYCNIKQDFLSFADGEREIVLFSFIVITIRLVFSSSFVCFVGWFVKELDLTE